MTLFPTITATDWRTALQRKEANTLSYQIAQAICALPRNPGIPPEEIRSLADEFGIEICDNDEAGESLADWKIKAKQIDRVVMTMKSLGYQVSKFRDESERKTKWRFKR